MKSLVVCLLLIFSCSTGFSQILDRESVQYNSDYVEALQDKEYWIIVISEDWCQACKIMKQEVAALKAEGYTLRVTFLSTSNKYAKRITAINKLTNPDAPNFIPDWSVYKHDGESFIGIDRHIGFENRDQLMKYVTEKKI